jgi:hypothetical protein
MSVVVVVFWLGNDESDDAHAESKVTTANEMASVWPNRIRRVSMPQQYG